jgi:3',5'-cyclic AMP phosphodiesterase CpdA
VKPSSRFAAMGIGTLAIVAAVALPRVRQTVAPHASGAAAARGELGEQASGQSAVLVGAGDVANCEVQGAARTARLLDSIPGTVFVAGDAAYASARDPNPFRTCYESTWGRHKARTRPVLGNHDYEASTPKMYFDYFGATAGRAPGGYYSYDVGPWHVVALNSNVAMEAGSEQDRWLRRDLAANAGRCGVAIVHHPRFSSGPHRDHARMVPAWAALQRHGVSVMIAGHDHLYERFAPMGIDGARDDAAGIRQFVVGTGGGGHYRFTKTDTGSEVRIEQTYGLLKLTLAPSSYRWEFIPTDPTHQRDQGESRCHPLRS